MKKILFLVLTCAISQLVVAQGFVGRTNEAQVDFKGVPISTPLPEISWVAPKLESSFSEIPTLTLEFTVKSHVELRELKLLVHSGAETKERRYPAQTYQLGSIMKQSVALVDGENVLEIIATNVKGGQVTSRRSILVGRDNVKLLSANRKDYALIFTTDKYDYWDDLVNPVEDGRSIAGVLQEKYGFEVEMVENATYEEILAKLTDYNAKKFNVQDQLFIFFAGHGSFDETLGEGYVVASNSLREDRGRTTYLPHTVLRQRIENMKCEHIFLAMDVCFGGTIDPILAASRAAAMDETSDDDFLLRKLSKRTRKFLTSGSKEYVSDGVPGKHSPFASKFLTALREVGDGKDRILTLTELLGYFQKLPTEPRSGGFGTDDKASDFVFVTGN